MAQPISTNKTLRQYRKDQQQKRVYPTGPDFEDFLLMEGADRSLPDQALWRAVILQMVSDALSNSHKAEQKRWKKDALHWLTRHSKDFRMVSDYAGYDSDWLQEQINRFLQLHHAQEAPKPAPPSPSSINLKTNGAQFSVSYRFNSSPAPLMQGLPA